LEPIILVQMKYSKRKTFYFLPQAQIYYKLNIDKP